LAGLSKLPLSFRSSGGALVAAIALLLAQRIMRTTLSPRVQPVLDSMQPDAVGR